MQVAKHLYLILVIYLVTGAAACNTDKSSLGQLGSEERSIVVQNENQNFDKKRWAKTGPELRGKMVADLLQSRQFAGKKNSEVFQLLGERTCYIDYEDQPCYELILDDKWYFLVFGVNHSDDRGMIVDIDLFPRN